MKLCYRALAFVALAVAASQATAQIFAPGDTIYGVQSDGVNANVGVPGTDAETNNWPEPEAPPNAIDGTVAKYLNFGEENTGIVVTPASGSSTATSITVWTANDAPERDPTSYELLGSNSAIGAGPFALGDFTLIASGDLSLPTTGGVDDDGRNKADPLDPTLLATANFDNDVAYTSYMVLFPGVRDSAAANSMQIAEVQLNANVIPEPASLTLALLSCGALVVRRRR